MNDQTQPHIDPTIDPDEYALGDEVRPKPRRNAAKRVERANRRREAFLLRSRGESFENIAQHLGVAPKTVSIWVREAIAAMPQEEAEDLRKMELARLDQMLKPMMAGALLGDVFAVDRVLRIMERRARYLNLDAATTAGLREVGTLLDALVNGAGQDDGEAAA